MKSFSIAATLVLLSAMAAARAVRPRPIDAAPYHQHVRQVAASLPRRIGDWVGTDTQVPPAAVEMLQPNVLIHREYRHLPSGRTASLLLVQCKDARDLAGHFPPVCYPAHGWRETRREPHDWHLDGQVIHGTLYGFQFRGAPGVRRMAVANFMVLPDGRTLRDMEGVQRAAADYTRHFLGAAQVQIVMDAAIGETQRDEAVEQLLRGCRDVIEAIRLPGDPVMASNRSG